MIASFVTRFPPLSCFACLSLLAVFAACGPEPDVCDAGATQECVCTSGGSGTQVCNDDGSGWGPCLPYKGADEDVGGCQPDCSGRQCGNDGCGGSCGTCLTPQGKENGCLGLVSGHSYCPTTEDDPNGITLAVWTTDGCERGCTINPQVYDVWDEETAQMVKGTVTWEVNDMCLPIEEKDFFGSKCTVCQKAETDRWRVNCDGTVTDLISGLMWQRGSAERSTVPSVKTYCESLLLAGYPDWRFPTLDELRTQVINCVELSPAGDCAVDGSCESSHENCRCWTSGPFYDKSVWMHSGYAPFISSDSCYSSFDKKEYAWCIDFGNAIIAECAGNFSEYVRCVRP